MPLFRKFLNGIAIAILAIFAPLVAIAVYAVETMRVRRRGRRSAVAPSGETVVMLAPRLRHRGATGRPQDGGAVILAFRKRASLDMATDDPRAVAGSR